MCSRAIAIKPHAAAHATARTRIPPRLASVHTPTPHTLPFMLKPSPELTEDDRTRNSPKSIAAATVPPFSK
ncbi:hypothetical protein GUJ93_ZPchr0011g28273 [Zizania palustris]|uniref:Uncharacterized protein n=1 Tax=Zizania palustris TaxID=103762 RepID=A0A8J5WDZ6_ZIZPA|nr:hypothetical protein GUJ93_ZPchr0011g28273 [Zizania palustris]